MAAKVPELLNPKSLNWKLQAATTEFWVAVLNRDFNRGGGGKCKGSKKRKKHPQTDLSKRVPPPPPPPTSTKVLGARVWGTYSTPKNPKP